MDATTLSRKPSRTIAILLDELRNCCGPCREISRLVSESFVPEIKIARHSEYVVDKILDRRFLKGREVEYLIKWKGSPRKENTWEPMRTLTKFKHLTMKFDADRQRIDATKRKEQIQFIMTMQRLAENAESNFQLGMTVEKVLGVAMQHGSLLFLVKWNDQEKNDVIPASVAHTKFPQEVITFYQNRIVFLDNI